MGKEKVREGRERGGRCWDEGETEGGGKGKERRRERLG